jgi:hypothetical protein
MKIGGPTWINPGDKITVGRSQLLVSDGFGAPAPVQVDVDSGGGGFSPWLILGLIAGAGFLLLAGVAFLYFLLF